MIRRLKKGTRKTEKEQTWWRFVRLLTTVPPSRRDGDQSSIAASGTPNIDMNIAVLSDFLQHDDLTARLAQLVRAPSETFRRLTVQPASV